jgi:acetamidase/formamidase
MTEHIMPSGAIHHDWARDRPAALTIASGDVVHYDIPMAGHGQVTRGEGYADTAFDFDTLYHLAGPLAVEGADPGDTLQIDILSLETGAWGWTAILPELGLLPDEFPEGYLRTFELAGRETIAVAARVEVPITPFFGTMGCATDVAGAHLPFPPHAGGGNVDTRHLVAGSTLWLPVHLPGGSFSVGDPHAAQGDGEVCVSAVECPMRASLRFTLLRRRIATPRFRVPGPLTPAVDDGGHLATMGIADDLMEGARIAVRAMIAWVVDEHDLDPRDAYVLCSLAGDLKIFEIVDAGVFNVGMTLPAAVFRTGARS